jgi:hypothetical protein
MQRNRLWLTYLLIWAMAAIGLWALASLVM